MELFDSTRDPRADIAEAVAAARTDGRDVLVVFGARWCPDCAAFESFTNDPLVHALLDERFHLVSVSVGDDRGQRDLNADVDADYNHPIEGGIPALSVLNPEGKIRYDSADGEFARARDMRPADLVAFLTEERS
jgi:thiol-disulfide isomerase/thioredoxin